MRYSSGIVEWTKEDLDVKTDDHEWYVSSVGKCEQALSSEVRGR